MKQSTFYVVGTDCPNKGTTRKGGGADTNEKETFEVES